MRVSLLYVASSLLSLVAAQQPSGPNPFTLPPGFMINAGEPTPITWTPTTGGTVSIRLRAGASSNLEEGTIIASDIENNGKATITLPADTTRNSDYALQIVSGPGEDDSNYSAQFVVESDNTVKSVSSAPSSASATSAASMTSEDSSSTTEASSMTTTGASTRSSMSTMTGSSSMTRSTGSATATSEESSPTGESAAPAEGTTAPSSGAMSLRSGSLLLAVVAGLALAW